MGFLNIVKRGDSRKSTPNLLNALHPQTFSLHDLNHLLFALAESNGSPTIREQIEKQLPAVRLFSKVHSSKSRPIPSGTTIVTEASDQYQFTVGRIGPESFIVFHINFDDPRIQPVLFEMTWSEALRVIESMPKVAGLLLWNNDKSYIGYKKADFPRLRTILGIAAP